MLGPTSVPHCTVGWLEPEWLLALWSDGEPDPTRHRPRGPCITPMCSWFLSVVDFPSRRRLPSLKPVRPPAFGREVLRHLEACHPLVRTALAETEAARSRVEAFGEGGVQRGEE
jgi:hypothetical protein